jgi:hypothetical protein
VTSRLGLGTDNRGQEELGELAAENWELGTVFQLNLFTRRRKRIS